jgi:hypothetical protein
MSWTLEELQRYMDEHIASIEKFKLAPNAMQNIPENLKEDLFSRMEPLHRGVCGDMQEREYVYVMLSGIEGISLSDEQINTIGKYHYRAYDKMARTVLECSNNDEADWRILARILYNSEKYFRKQLTPSQVKEYEQTVKTWNHENPAYMPNEIFESYRLLLNSKK